MYENYSFNLDISFANAFVSCYLQEVMSMLIILSEKSWSLRLSQVYDLFVGMGSDNIGYDDVILIAQVSHGTFRIRIGLIYALRWWEQPFLACGSLNGTSRN